MQMQLTTTWPPFSHNLRTGFNSSLPPIWETIESSYILRQPLKTWLFCTQFGISTPSYFPPTMIASVKVWQKLISSSQEYTDNVTLNIPLSTLQNLAVDISLAHWSHKGIQYPNDLYTPSGPKSFPCLQMEYNWRTDNYLHIYTYPTV